jgi:hypothetical protein
LLKYSICPLLKDFAEAGQWWLTPVILATLEAEIRRNAVLKPSPRQIVSKTLS